MSKTLKTLASLAESGFLQVANRKVQSFDTLGLFVRENVKNQLKKFYKQNDKFSYFLSNDLHDVKRFVSTFAELDSLVNSFALVYKRSSSAQPALSLIDQSNAQDQSKDRPNSAVALSSQCLALFCNRELSLNYFHWLQSQRHRFWRRLAANPSTFEMSSVAISETNCQSLEIIYKDQETSLDLEKISYYKTLDHLNIADTDDRLKDYWSSLDLILCETNVDLSTLGLLCDSYNEKAGKPFMSLNEYLTPYQYAVTVVSAGRKLESRSKELINYVFERSKRMDLNIYPFVSFNDRNDLRFENYDKIGVLYTILVEENELEKGFVSLRNRDTNIIEKFHVTQLESYLSLYAKLK